MLQDKHAVPTVKVVALGLTEQEVELIRRTGTPVLSLSFAAEEDLRRACSEDNHIVVVLSQGNSDVDLEEFASSLRRDFCWIPILGVLRRACNKSASRLVKAGADLVVDEANLAEWGDLLEEMRGFKAPKVATCDEQREYWGQNLVGRSWPLRVIGHTIRLVAPRTATVLITGQTGTGKEVVARAIHMASARSTGPMVCLNCAAIPQDLLEAEVFGHVKGAFTGAINHRIGLIQQAHEGTLFLDEISEMPLNLQAKLLRVLQEREFQRLGCSETVQVDIRVIAATNADLAKRVAEGRFREDLYYRLRVVPIHIPPLRERKEDIPLLAEHFITKTCRFEKIAPKSLSNEALELLLDHDWPGNVREMENAISMALTLSGATPRLEVWHFPVLMAPAQVQPPPSILPPEGIDYDHVVTTFRRSLLEQALRAAKGNKSQAAQLLGMKRTTLNNALKLMNLGGDDECLDDGASQKLTAMAS
jgi:transcriptional regulator with GAF, ATPase, and Fis domain